MVLGGRFLPRMPFYTSSICLMRFESCLLRKRRWPLTVGDEKVDGALFFYKMQFQTGIFVKNFHREWIRIFLNPIMLFLLCMDLMGLFKHLFLKTSLLAKLPILNPYLTHENYLRWIFWLIYVLKILQSMLYLNKVSKIIS